MKAVDPLGGEWSATRNERGLVSQASDPLGAGVSLEYDASWDLVSATDPLGRRVSVVRDAGGRVDHRLALPRAARPQACTAEGGKAP